MTSGTPGIFDDFGNESFDDAFLDRKRPAAALVDPSLTTTDELPAA